MTKIFIIILSIALIISSFFLGPKASKLYKLSKLYDEKRIANNFINIDKLFAVSEPIPSAEIPYIFNTKGFELPKTYFFEDKEQDLASALEHFKTDGLIVLHQGDMLYENY